MNRRGRMHRIVAKGGEAATTGHQQARDEPQQRGFARTVGSDQAGNAPAADFAGQRGECRGGHPGK